MNAFSPRRAAAVARKEIRHIRRDPFTVAMALGMPLLIVVLFGYILDFDVKHIATVVTDRDQTRLSRVLTDVVQASGHFQFRPSPDPMATLADGRRKAALFIHPGFARDVERGGTALVQLVVDGADNQTAGVIGGYAAGLQEAAGRRLAEESGREPPRTPFRIVPRYLFNPELSSRWFMVTGLFVVVMGILSILLTALTVAREWETGSMELLLATPVQPLDIVLGKLAPYLGLGLAGSGMLYAAARILFHMPFRGSHGLFVLACLIFLSTTLAQGLVISVTTRQQTLAMQFANLSGMLPVTLLSGFIFPIESMPRFFQALTCLLPARWFLVIVRGLFLKGATFSELLVPFAALAVLNAALIALAAKKFKRDLEP